MVVFVEIYIYFIVIYLLESYHRLYFSVEESYVYYDFIRLYLLQSYILRDFCMITFIGTFTQLQNLNLLESYTYYITLYFKNNVFYIL